MLLAQVFCRERDKSRCKEGLARVFAVQAQSLLSITSVAIQSLNGAANLSSVTKLVVVTGAVSRRAPQKRSESGGTRLQQSQKLVTVKNFKLRADAGAITITNLS